MPAVLDDADDPDADGTNVILGSSCNRVDRLVECYVDAAAAGKCHAVLLPVDAAPADRRGDFPHGPEFTAADAPDLAPFFAAADKTKKHVVTLPPICHPNNWGDDDVENAKITADLEQAFSDAHGERAAH